MNRFDEITELLEYYKRRTYNTNIKKIKIKDVHNHLVRYGLSNEEYIEGIAYKYDDEFEKWKKRYKNNPFLYVYESKYQLDFLQFVSENRDVDRLKLYISIGRNNIEEAANRIFDYISKNKMHSISRVAKYDGSDVIVLRMAKEEDTTKLINYINSDPFFTKNCRKTNPFLMRQGVVGLAFDKYLSYNNVVAMLLTEYLNNHIKNNTLKNVTLNDFKSYLLEMYRDTFMTQTNLTNFEQLPVVLDSIEKLPHSEVDILLNYMHIINGIYTNISSNDYTDYIKAYRTSKSENINKKYGESIKQTLESKQKKVNPQAILDNYIKYAFQKYGSIAEVESHLVNYLYGNESAITRDNGYRKEFINNLDINTCNYIIKNNISEYVTKVINESNIKNVKNRK